MLDQPPPDTTNNATQQVQVAAGALILPGLLHIPDHARGIVVLAHGSNNVESDAHYDELAAGLQQARLATLFVHLLTEEEEKIDNETHFFRFNVNILHQRLMGLARWLLDTPATQNLGIGYFGIGPTGAAALIAAAERSDAIQAVVIGNGRIDLAQPYLSRVLAPTLLLVGERDSTAVNSNRDALTQLPAKAETNKRLETLPGVTQLFETLASLKKVIELSSQWFQRHLKPII